MKIKYLYQLLLSMIIFFLIIYIILMTIYMIKPQDSSFYFDNNKIKIELRENLSKPASSSDSSNFINDILSLQTQKITIIMYNQDIPGIGYKSNVKSKQEIVDQIGLSAENYYEIYGDLDCFGDYFISSSTNITNQVNAILSKYSNNDTFKITSRKIDRINIYRLISPVYILYLETLIFVLLTYFFIINTKIWGTHTIVISHYLSGGGLKGMTNLLLKKTLPYIMIGYILGLILYYLLLGDIWGFPSILVILLAACLSIIVYVLSYSIAIKREYNKVVAGGIRHV